MVKKKQNTTEHEKEPSVEFVSPHNNVVSVLSPTKERMDEEFSFCPISNQVAKDDIESKIYEQLDTSLSGVAAITAAAECFKSFPMSHHKSPIQDKKLNCPNSIEKCRFEDNNFVVSMADVSFKTDDHKNISVSNINLYVDKDMSSIKSTVCNCRKSRCLKM